MPSEKPSSRQRSRAMDVVITNSEASVDQVLDFVDACAVLEAVIIKENPDIVFYPQRGSGPIQWTVNALMEQKNENSAPVSVDLPLGTYRFTSDRERTQRSGINTTEKRSIVSQSMNCLQSDGIYTPGESKLMLVDEVQSGGTLSRAATAIRLAMDSVDDGQLLNVVAFQDGRSELVGGKNAKRVRIFERLASNQSRGMKAYVIPTELFTVDRPALLDEIIRDVEVDSDNLGDQFEIKPNNSARNFFQALAHTYRNPEAALEEIDNLRREIVVSSVGAAALQNSILEYVTNPQPVWSRRQRTADISELLNWWEQFALVKKGR